MSLNQEAQWLLKEKYDGAESEAFRADLERLADGEPLGYVIGHVPFLGCRIRLDSRPLIPRPETEYWVEKAVAGIKTAAGPQGRPLRVLDLCAGSGAIGVAVAKAVLNVQVDFAELDERHHATIRKNLEANSIAPERIRIFGGDLFEQTADRYHFILTNPPYIDPALDRAEPSVKAHEPHVALYGGVGGMELIDRIIQASPRHLTERAQLWLEHEPEQAVAIRQSAEAVGFRATAHFDQYDVERFSILKRVYSIGTETYSLEKHGG